MTTVRRIRRVRRLAIPVWAQQLLAGGPRPPKDTPEHYEFFGWMWLGDDVPGLPEAQSEAGSRLLRVEIYNRLAAQGAFDDDDDEP